MAKARINGVQLTEEVKPRSALRSGIAIASYLALATIILHLWSGAQYGFQRDELATLEDARHLDWGYVAYPPMTPFFARLSLELFGTSLRGFRLFAALAEAAAVILAALMCRSLGGKRWAQAAAAGMALPFCIGGGALMQYVSFDYLCWVLVAYFTIRLLESENQRWWLAIGAAIGAGMLSKYSMPFLVCGLVCGILFSKARTHLLSKWLWLGAALSVFIFLPNLIWQAQHHFVSLDFLQHIHARDVSQGRHLGFLSGQIKITLLALPVWIAGLYFYLLSPGGRRYRALGWMYVVPLVLFVVGKGRDYYLAGTYPMLYAAGSVYIEHWLDSLSSRTVRIFKSSIWVAIAIDAAIAVAFTLPIAPVQSHWFQIANRINGDFREEIGWPELVETVAHIRDSLPEQDRMHLGVLGTNYGEAGAINLYGSQYGLPSAISGINSFWYKGYGNPPPDVVIVIGLPKRVAETKFQTCDLAGHITNQYNIANEETSNHPDIFVCRGARPNWPEMWRNFQYYG